MFTNNSAIFAAVTASLQAVPIDAQITVLLHVNKLLAKCLAKKNVCPHLHSCRFAQNCWYQHPQTGNPPLCHDPYSPPLHHRNSPFCHAETQTRWTGQVLYPHTQKFHTSTTETTDTPGTSPVPLACAVTPSTKTTPTHLNRRVRQDSDTSEEWTTVRTRHHRSRSSNQDHQIKQNSPENEGARKCKNCSADFHLSIDQKKWFLDRGLHIPLTCSQCRQNSKTHAHEDTHAPAARPRLPFVPDKSPPILRQNNGVRERVPDFNQVNYPALPAPAKSSQPHVPNHRRKRKSSTIQPTTTPSSPRTPRSESPPSPTTTAKSSTSKATITDTPKGSFCDSSSSKSSCSSSPDSSPEKKGSYWSTGQHSESHDSPGEQENFWTGYDHSSDADMPELQSSSSEGTHTPKPASVKGAHTTIPFPSIDDFFFKDRALRVQLSHILSNAHHHREAFHAAWSWVWQQDCHMYSADMARLLISKIKRQNFSAA